MSIFRQLCNGDGGGGGRSPPQRWDGVGEGGGWTPKASTPTPKAPTPYPCEAISHLWVGENA